MKTRVEVGQKVKVRKQQENEYPTFRDKILIIEEKSSESIVKCKVESENGEFSSVYFDISDIIMLPEK